ncbi:MAG: hypothetical protein HYZ36_09145 [Pedosphaera parvula]|nr:hypothetical protein [Pedosphaera parvula]
MVKFIQAEAPADRPRPATPAPAAPAAEPAQRTSTPDNGPAENVRKPKSRSGPIDMEEFKNDPLIKKALEIFKGQIVDVRA